jgi:hypothetical protein
MQTNSPGLLLLVLMVPAFSAGIAGDPAATATGGKTVFSWTDSEGRMHFSDQSPVDEVGSVESRLLPAAPPPSQGSDDDYFSVENQAKRLEEARRRRSEARQQERREREERKLRRAEIEAAQAQKEASEAQRQAAEDSTGIYVPRYGWPVYPRYPVHPIRPIRPRPLPEPPPRRPVHRLPRVLTR